MTIMSRRFITFVFFLLLVFVFTSNISAIDFWRYPEMAEKYSIFAGGFAASFNYSLTKLRNFSFGINHPEFYIDFLLPVGLPFSFGSSIRALKPGHFGIDARPGYHINFNVPNLDLYVLYNIGLDFVEGEYALLKWGPRVGVRYLFFNFLCANIETGFQGKSIRFGISVKLN